MDSDDLEQKQKYLSTQILQANYDPEEFQDFMLNNSNKQLDLNQWSMQELVKIVKKYKKHKNSQQEQEMEDVTKQNRCSEQENVQNQKLDRKDSYNQNHYDDTMSMAPSVNTSKYKHFQIRKKVNLPQIYVLMYMEKKKFSVTVSKYLKSVPNNIFKSSYILYEIQTSQKWCVKRRFTDFQWIHKNLRNNYPGLPIPPIPLKTAMRSFDEKHIKERMKVFQKFLNTLTHMPEICSDPILQIFLRADDQYFSQAKKKYQVKTKQNYETCTLQSIWGDELILAEHGVMENKDIESFHQIKGIYERINSNLDSVKDMIYKSAHWCYDTAGSFEKSETLTKSFAHNQILSVLQSFFLQMGEHLKKTANYIQKSIHELWNYQTLYITNLSKYMTNIKREQIEMNQKYKNTMMKISDQSVDQMVNSEPNKVIKEYQIAKEQYKIKLSYTIREMERYRNHSLVGLTKSWIESIKIYIGDLNQQAIGQVDQLTRAMSIGQGKDLMQVQYVKT